MGNGGVNLWRGEAKSTSELFFGVLTEKTNKQLVFGAGSEWVMVTGDFSATAAKLKVGTTYRLDFTHDGCVLAKISRLNKTVIWKE